MPLPYHSSTALAWLPSGGDFIALVCTEFNRDCDHNGVKRCLSPNLITSLSPDSAGADAYDIWVIALIEEAAVAEKNQYSNFLRMN